MAERKKAASLLTIPCSTEKTGTGVTVIIGPEGGWSAGELEAVQSKNWAFASFGKEILRAETASLAALAILQARFNT
jgi:16S rRNA (uracil1498-N3)-methyltransferase